jgi:hypothetical protein
MHEGGPIELTGTFPLSSRPVDDAAGRVEEPELAAHAIDHKHPTV